MEINFEEMQVYDFSNLNLQEECNDNCFSCDGCDAGCEGCDNCDACNCDSCDNSGCDKW